MTTSRIKSFFRELRGVAMAGFFFLLPVYVVFIIIAKAWTSLGSMGTNVAAMFGMKSIFGVKGSSVVSGVLLIVLWLLCGLLVRVSFIAALHRTVEDLLTKHIPGYQAYKTIAEDKLNKTSRTASYTSVLLKHQEYWRPAYVVEQDQEGNLIVFIPDVPNTNAGHVVLAKREQVKLLPSVTANQFDASLKKMGRGLLTELNGISEPVTQARTIESANTSPGNAA